jgi:exosortase A
MTATTADRTAHSGVAGSAWRLPATLAAGSVAALAALYYPSFLSMAAIWWRSETFAHGVLVFPVSLWLIGRRRSDLARLPPGPDWRALPALLVLGLGWFLANLSGVLVAEQAAVVGMIPALVWLILGARVLGALAFPLGFLLFSVPVGEFLIPPMMAFTAGFTVKLIELSGIPVFREGTFFSVPGGDWSVVEGCSGLRYCIASVTLGCLYAYLNYRSPARRLGFVALAALFPVVANGLRAYLIVMIAHWSDRKLAMGVDHLVYGWVFFGVVMALLFRIGALWRDRGGDGAAGAAPFGNIRRAAGVPRRRDFLAAALAALCVLSLWPARAAYLRSLVERRTLPVLLAAPSAAEPWRAAAAFTGWEPSYVGPDARFKAFYRDGADAVGLYLMVYRRQRQGAELINSQNVLIRQKHPVWRMPEETPRRVAVNGRPLTVLQGRLRSAEQKLLTWRWNRIAGRYTASDYFGKWLEARDRLLGTIRDGAAIVVATEYRDDAEIEPAARVLRRYLDAMLPALERSLRDDP